MIGLLRALLMLILAATPAVAQTTAASGELHGLVLDPSEAAIVGAAVTARNEATGAVREVVTGASGEYRFLLLPPGDYTLQFESARFRRSVLTGVRVTVGQSANVNATLQLGNLVEVVEVVGAPSMLEPRRVDQVNTLEREAIENLPIGRRDYLTFALLTPGIVDTTALADNTDARPKQTPNSGLSVFGSNGRGNSVTVDGGEVNDGGGGIRSTITQEAVQEFQINRSNYTAQFGSASGAAINIVSKSGGNSVNGTIFGFLRDDTLDAGDSFARVLQNGRLVRIKPPAARKQFGASLGAPIRRDRTAVFGAFEGLVRDESAVTTLFTDSSIFQPTAAQNAVLNTLPAAMAQPLRAALTAPQSTVDFFSKNSGVFPYKTRSWKFSVRLDHNAGGDRFFLRHNYSHQTETNANLQALVGASRGLETYTLDPTTVGKWTRFIDSNTINDLTLQWNYRTFNVNSIDKFGPEIRIAGFGIFNRDFTLPASNIERRYQVRDDFMTVRSSHTLKFGGEFLIRGSHADNGVFSGGRFTFGALPGSLLNPALPPSFTINALQAYNLGLAQTYFQGVGDGIVEANNPYYAVYGEDNWQVREGFTLSLGLRYELDMHNPPIPSDKNNLAPRVGFAWTPFESGRTVVRGGYGIYYAPIYFQTDWVATALNDFNGSRQIAQLFTTIQTPGPLAAHNIFSTLRAQGVIGTREITAADLAQFGGSFPRTGPLPPFSVVYSNSTDFESSYSQQAGLSVDREITPDVAVSVGYTFTRTAKIPRTRDSNLNAAPIDPTLGIRVWSNPARDFVNPSIAQRGFLESTANAFYHGMVAEVRKRFGGSFSLNVNYTLSKAIDEVVDFNSDYEATDQTNQRAERALSSFDQRHKLVVYGIWDAPGGVKLSPVFRANSGRPFNLLVGFDLNRDRHDITDRPPFAGRNTGLGPAFWTLDLRVSRSIQLPGDTQSIEFMVEGFNLFNRLNFSSINNTVGVMPPPFDVRGHRDRSPSEPLGFTSAYDARKIQLGARFRF